MLLNTCTEYFIQCESCKFSIIRSGISFNENTQTYALHTHTYVYANTRTFFGFADCVCVCGFFLIFIFHAPATKSWVGFPLRYTRWVEKCGKRHGNMGAYQFLYVVCGCSCVCVFWRTNAHVQHLFRWVGISGVVDFVYISPANGRAESFLLKIYVCVYINLAFGLRYCLYSVHCAHTQSAQCV